MAAEDARKDVLIDDFSAFTRGREDVGLAGYTAEERRGRMLRFEEATERPVVVDPRVTGRFRVCMRHTSHNCR